MNKIQIIKIILGLICSLFLFWGVIWFYLLIEGARRFGGITIFIEEYVAQSSALMVAVCVSSTIILLKTISNRRITHPKQYYAVALIGFLIAGLNSISMLATPYTIINANSEFDEVFGKGWEEKIPDSAKDQFLPVPYNIPSHFLTIKREGFKVEKDILFYDGEGIKLHFDVYFPTVNPNELPGKGGIIINLHPGAWSSGGKGTWNMISTSQYLASQGYIVFDIEYGLIEWFKYVAPAPDTPEYVYGDFTIEDQVRHIGIFTKKLASEYASTYKANLDSVYFMGRSAGAHLAGVCGLGYNDKYHSGTFSSLITVKGIIPLYCPPAAPDSLLEETREQNEARFNAYALSKLADKNDPPLILFQGSSDGQVKIEWVVEMEIEIEAAGASCCLLIFPFAGHANDFVLDTNIGQVWMYYLERFLYLTQ